jgi:Domain of unknown function (DUF4881)
MLKKYCGLTLLVLLPLILAYGCGEMGKVDQGRVIEFDKAKGTVTLIQDMKADPKNPDYSHLPPVTYEIPKDSAEMGPEPKAGLRMKLDAKAKQIVIFDPAAKEFKKIDYTLIDQKEGVDAENPLVLDKKFPLVEKEKKAITLYSKRQKLLTTFSVPDEYFALPDSAWDAGDEVRIYYKETGKARRLMNISKTNIYKK